MGVSDASHLFLSLNHFAALGAAALFCAESALLGLALAGTLRSRRADPRA